MKKEEALIKLRKTLGYPEDWDFDPELFLLRLQKAITGNQEDMAKIAKQLADHSIKAVDNERAMQIKSLEEFNGQLSSLRSELIKAITERKIDRVEVETVREVPPSKFQIDVNQKDGPLPATQQKWWQKTLFDFGSSLTKGLPQGIQDILERIQKPENAIAVKLTRADGKSFYTAIVSAVMGGMDTSTLAKDGTLATIGDTGDMIYLMVNGVRTGYAVQSITIDIAANGTLIAAVSTKKIRVISGFWVIASDGTVTVKGHTTTSTPHSTGAMTIKSGGGFMWPRNVDGWIETVAGEALDVAVASQMSGQLRYITI